MSPEVLNGSYGIECDLWSAGCILYVLLCGSPPFYGEDDQEVLKMVQNAKYGFDQDVWSSVSKEAKDLIKQLICKTEKRLTAQEALEHPWIKKYAAAESKQAEKEVAHPKMDTLLNFDKYSKMKKIVLAAIATQLNPKDVKNLKTLFESLDTDGNGSLSLNELEQGL